jgi:NADP-dependent 3-hydroxy acid dehydrogenase YdfG
MDVRDRDSMGRPILDAFTDRAAGGIDVLFNNAGIGTGGPIADDELRGYRSR